MRFGKNNFDWFWDFLGFFSPFCFGCKKFLQLHYDNNDAINDASDDIYFVSSRLLCIYWLGLSPTPEKEKKKKGKEKKNETVGFLKAI